MTDFESQPENEDNTLAGLAELYPLAFAAAAISNAPTGLALRRRGVTGLIFPGNDEESKAFTDTQAG